MGLEIDEGMGEGFTSMRHFSMAIVRLQADRNRAQAARAQAYTYL